MNQPTPEQEAAMSDQADAIERALKKLARARGRVNDAEQVLRAALVPAPHPSTDHERWTQEELDAAEQEAAQIRRDLEWGSEGQDEDQEPVRVIQGTEGEIQPGDYIVECDECGHAIKVIQPPDYREGIERAVERIRRMATDQDKPDGDRPVAFYVAECLRDIADDLEALIQPSGEDE